MSTPANIRQRYFEVLLLAYVMLDRTALVDRHRPRVGRAARFALRYIERVPPKDPVSPDGVFDSSWSEPEASRAAAAQMTEDALEIKVYDLQLWPRERVLQELGALPMTPRTTIGRLVQRTIATT